MAMNVIMLGAPGAGKGTQADRFARKHGLPKISTGDILRDGIKKQLPLALIAKQEMDRGELVDDETIVGIVRQRLSEPDTQAGFVLDGFPRTVTQAMALDRIMEARGSDPLVVVDIVVSETELVRRLSTRRICSNCGANADPMNAAATACAACGGPLVYRTDDNDRIVLERLRVYRENTQPVVGYYRQRPTFREVNGSQSPDAVARELETTIHNALRAASGTPLEARS
jgi:adenylate kinase